MTETKQLPNISATYQQRSAGGSACYDHASAEPQVLGQEAINCCGNDGAPEYATQDAQWIRITVITATEVHGQDPNGSIYRNINI